MSDNQVIKYSGLLQKLHWLTLVLIIATFAFIEFRGIFPKGTDNRDLMKLCHFTLGFTLLLLTAIRWFIRRLPNNLAAIQTITPPIARYAHLCFYFLLITMPILGWLILSAEGKSLVYFGLELPRLITENHELAEVFEETHELLGKLFYLLITVHALAALYHHVIKKDHTLKKMLP
ncbi:cytochrome b [Thalassotalea insulae]|uniref:Cytochrome b n=1 Tax=Thalassotalea insulae TaxID=2056778 RepID=A0ABQ6GPV7_9GAMM|nr:cytochrome b [Thalassotalea insulae]GLX77967.1 cytochrome b [Thalassotalea insulae]